jgi:hypothetical protein
MRPIRTDFNASPFVLKATTEEQEGAKDAKLRKEENGFNYLSDDRFFIFATLYLSLRLLAPT